MKFTKLIFGTKKGAVAPLRNQNQYKFRNLIPIWFLWLTNPTYLAGNKIKIEPKKSKIKNKKLNLYHFHTLARVQHTIQFTKKQRAVVYHALRLRVGLNQEKNPFVKKKKRKKRGKKKFSPLYALESLYIAEEQTEERKIYSE